MCGSGGVIAISGHELLMIRGRTNNSNKHKERKDVDTRRGTTWQGKQARAVGSTKVHLVPCPAFALRATGTCP